MSYNYMVGLIEQICGLIETPTAKTYTIVIKSNFSFTLNDITVKLASGTCTMAVKIDGVDVTSLSAISVTNGEQTVTASGANAAAAGTDLTLVLSAISSPVDLSFNIKTTRT